MLPPPTLTREKPVQLIWLRQSEVKLGAEAVIDHLVVSNMSASESCLSYI